MFEATLGQGALLKKILEAIKELVNEANLECSETGIGLQAMDTSHVSLVVLRLDKQGFRSYRADRSVLLGINMASMTKIVKCAGNDDSITLRCTDEPDTVTFVFENEEKDKISEFQLKLMEIDGETLSLPEQNFNATVTMPSSEFQRICRDLALLGDSVNISVSKEGVKFSTSGDVGSGNILVKQNANADAKEDQTIIEMEEPVSLNFALRYLNTFAKATSLSGQVVLHLSKEIPLVVHYKIENAGYIKYFLAPKIDEENDAGEE
jgi:proliferating cell nuclear antigen